MSPVRGCMPVSTKAAADSAINLPAFFVMRRIAFPQVMGND
jgi:hypothetical protein